MIDKNIQLRALKPTDTHRFRCMLNLFGHEFEEIETYSGNQPCDDYIHSLLRSESFLALVAEKDGEVIGAIACYELKKFEQERSEFYIYDLAVSEAHRRIGIATALIEALGKLAKERGAWTMYVQADPVDAPAVALYDKLGVRENVLHFDIAPK